MMYSNEVSRDIYLEKKHYWIWLRKNSSNIINYDLISSQIGEKVKGELMHENGFEFEAD